MYVRFGGTRNTKTWRKSTCTSDSSFFNDLGHATQKNFAETISGLTDQVINCLINNHLPVTSAVMPLN